MKATGAVVRAVLEACVLLVLLLLLPEQLPPGLESLVVLWLGSPTAQMQHMCGADRAATRLPGGAGRHGSVLAPCIKDSKHLFGFKATTCSTHRELQRYNLRHASCIESSNFHEVLVLTPQYTLEPAMALT